MRLSCQERRNQCDKRLVTLLGNEMPAAGDRFAPQIVRIAPQRRQRRVAGGVLGPTVNTGIVRGVAARRRFCRTVSGIAR